MVALHKALVQTQENLSSISGCLYQFNGMKVHLYTTLQGQKIFKDVDRKFNKPSETFYSFGK